jgi:hypothetical protein
MGISIDPYGPSKVNCFSCKFRGTLVHAIKLLGKYREKDYSDLIRRVGKIEELDPEQVAASIGSYEEEVQEKKDPLLGECLFRMRGIKKQTHQYAIDRGFTIETMKAWDCRYSERYKRLVFPAKSREPAPLGCGESNLVGAVGRTVIPNKKPTYYNFFTLPKAKYLFGEHMEPFAETAIVTEGALDTIAIWQALKEKNLLNKYSPLGLLGSMVSTAQVKKLVKWYTEVVLFVDNDPAGWTCQLELARRLQRSVLLRSVKYPKTGGSDPAALMRAGADLVEMVEQADLLIV